MKISTKGRYGLRMMIDLAEKYSDRLIPLKDIAARQEISDKYLEQIINQLNKANLVKSVRGSQGGYKLSRHPKDITVGEILRVLEGSLSPVYCADDCGETCERAKECKTLDLWIEMKNAIEKIVDNKTLLQILEEKNMSS